MKSIYRYKSHTPPPPQRRHFFPFPRFTNITIQTTLPLFCPLCICSALFTSAFPISLLFLSFSFIFSLYKSVNLFFEKFFILRVITSFPFSYFPPKSHQLICFIPPRGGRGHIFQYTPLSNPLIWSLTNALLTYLPHPCPDSNIENGAAAHLIFTRRLL